MLPHHNIVEMEDSYLVREIALSPRRLACKDDHVVGFLNALNFAPQWQVLYFGQQAEEWWDAHEHTTWHTFIYFSRVEKAINLRIICIQYV